MSLICAVCIVAGLSLAGSEAPTIYPNLLGLALLALAALIARRCEK